MQTLYLFASQVSTTNDKQRVTQSFVGVGCMLIINMKHVNQDQHAHTFSKDSNSFQRVILHPVKKEVTFESQQ